MQTGQFILTRLFFGKNFNMKKAALSGRFCCLSSLRYSKFLEELKIGHTE